MFQLVRRVTRTGIVENLEIDNPGHKPNIFLREASLPLGKGMR